MSNRESDGEGYAENTPQVFENRGRYFVKTALVVALSAGVLGGIVSHGLKQYLGQDPIVYTITGSDLVIATVVLIGYYYLVFPAMREFLIERWFP